MTAPFTKLPLEPIQDQPSSLSNLSPWLRSLSSKLKRQFAPQVRNNGLHLVKGFSSSYSFASFASFAVNWFCHYQITGFLGYKRICTRRWSTQSALNQLRRMI